MRNDYISIIRSYSLCEAFKLLLVLGFWHFRYFWYFWYFRYFRYLVLFSLLVSTFEGTLYKKENDDLESVFEQQHNEMASIKLRNENDNDTDNEMRKLAT